MPESTFQHTPSYTTDGLLEHLEVDAVIGRGTFGTVNKGSYLGTEVAVKVIPMSDDISILK